MAAATRQAQVCRQARSMTQHEDLRYFIIAKAGRQWLGGQPPSFHEIDGDEAPIIFDDKEDAIRALNALRPEDGQGATVLEVELQSAGDGTYAILLPPDYQSRYRQ
jgi:hypothetical protein